MGDYTSMRLRGVVKPKYRPVIASVVEEDGWIAAKGDAVLGEMYRQNRADFIPHGALSYTPDSWEDPTDPQYVQKENYDPTTGQWEFACSLKNENTIHYFLDRVPKVFDEISYLEYKDEYEDSIYYTLENGTLVPSETLPDYTVKRGSNLVDDMSKRPVRERFSNIYQSLAVGVNPGDPRLENDFRRELQAKLFQEGLVLSARQPADVMNDAIFSSLMRAMEENTTENIRMSQKAEYYQNMEDFFDKNDNREKFFDGFHTYFGEPADAIAQGRLKGTPSARILHYFNTLKDGYASEDMQVDNMMLDIIQDETFRQNLLLPEHNDPEYIQELITVDGGTYEGVSTVMRFAAVEGAGRLSRDTLAVKDIAAIVGGMQDMVDKDPDAYWKMAENFPRRYGGLSLDQRTINKMDKLVEDMREMNLGGNFPSEEMMNDFEHVYGGTEKELQAVHDGTHIFQSVDDLDYRAMEMDGMTREERMAILGYDAHGEKLETPYFDDAPPKELENMYIDEHGVDHTQEAVDAFRMEQILDKKSRGEDLTHDEIYEFRQNLKEEYKRAETDEDLDRLLKEYPDDMDYVLDELFHEEQARQEDRDNAVHEVMDYEEEQRSLEMDQHLESNLPTRGMSYGRNVEGTNASYEKTQYKTVTEEKAHREMKDQQASKNQEFRKYLESKPKSNHAQFDVSDDYGFEEAEDDGPEL